MQNEIDNSNKRAPLLQAMQQLHEKSINCSRCTGKCCTFMANSMQISSSECDDIMEYLLANDLISAELISSLEKCIRDFRLDIPVPGDGLRDLKRRHYTCPFFTHESLGCSLPAEVKPYGCLAFNPASEGITDGGNCRSDLELLEQVSAVILDEEKRSIPVALLERIKNAD